MNLYLSSFLLALFVFLQSAVYLTWFTVDPKLLGFIGIAFVVVFIIEILLGAYGRPNTIYRRQP